MKFSENYYSSMDPEYSSAMAGERFANMKLGAPTSAVTPMQLQQLTQLSSTGLQNIEVGPIATEKWDQIPREHFDEMRRQAKLLGVKPSVHGPIEDPLGFTPQGQFGGEAQRLQTERLFKEILEKAHKLDPKGNIPVTFHITAGAPGDTYEKGLVVKDEITGKEVEVPRRMTVIDPESKQVTMVEYEKREYPGGREEIYHPMRRLKERNHSMWINFKESMEDALHKYHYSKRTQMGFAPKITALKYAEKTGTITPQQREELRFMESQVEGYGERAKLQEQNFGSYLQTAFNKAMKANPAFKESKVYRSFNSGYNDISNQMLDVARRIEKTKDPNTQQVLNDRFRELANKQENLVRSLLRSRDMPEPQFFRPVNEWAKDEAAKTFSEVAVHGFSQFKGKAPTISIENYRPDTALGNMADFREAILRARKETAKKLMSGDYKDKDGKVIKLSKGEAEKTAERMIGTTWDVGHVNIWKRFGYDNKKILEETKKIADTVKHVHITDNFGFSDSHLAPGMGNVPVREHLKILEKAGKLKDIRAIVEAATVPAELKQDPTIPMLQYFNSPVYGWEFSPGWEEVGHSYFFGSSGYSAGYGTILPGTHFSMYGSGFSQMPLAVGGVTPSEEKKSQFTGTPMS